MTFNWDSEYESLPTDQLNRALIDNAIRNIKVGIRERMEVEHEWGPNTDEDTGRHRKGHVSIAMRGDATTRDALVSPQPGSLYLLEDGSDLQLFLYFDPAGGTNYSWNKISTLDHSSFIDKDTGDPHPQYTLKSGGVMNGQLDMNGNLLKAPSGNSTDWGASSLWGHRNTNHTKVGNIDAVVADSLTTPKLNLLSDEITSQVAANSWYSFVIPYGSFIFFPQIYADGLSTYLKLAGGIYPNVYLRLCNYQSTSSTTYNFRYRVRYFQ